MILDKTKTSHCDNLIYNEETFNFVDKKIWGFILICRNPDVPEGKSLGDVFKESGAVRPRDWRVDPWKLDEHNPKNNGFENEDLIVWMRAAALPNFRYIAYILTYYLFVT